MPGFSLWMMPPPAVADRFRALIAGLARRGGTPPFEPHLTLTGVEAATEAAAVAAVVPIAAHLAPLPVRLTDIGTTPEYYRCLFLRAEPNAALTEAYRYACRTLGQPPGEFMPHLSLVYGDLAETEKQRLSAHIDRDVARDFTVARLGLYTTDGPPPAWRCIGEFALRAG